MARPFASGSVLLVASVVFAGCMGGGNGDDDAGVPVVQAPIDWPALALAGGEDHDHLDAAQHTNGSTPNFEVLGWDPLITEYHGKTAGSYLCGDVADNEGRRIGVVHSHFTDVAFVLVDLTDPTAPRTIGELVLPNTFIYDVAITPDADFVLLATSDPSSEDEGPTPPGLPADLSDFNKARLWGTLHPDGVGPFGSTPYFRDACGVERPINIPPELNMLPFSSGVTLVDIRTPEAPEVLDYEPAPVLGAHSVFATHANEMDIVLASVTNLIHQASQFTFYTIQELPVIGPQLMLESVYRPTPPASQAQPAVNGHTDGWIVIHPVTNDLTAFLADWDGGLVLVDISNLKTPMELGRWTDFEGVSGDPDNVPFNSNQGSIHTALPMQDMWGNRHITIIGQEILTRPQDTPTGVIFIMDTTDPTNPHPIGAWTLPVDPLWDDDLLYSTHYVTVSERTLFVTMYHGGVWAVDLSNEKSPRSVGVFLPSNVSPEPPGDLYAQYNWTPTVLEVEAIGNNTVTVWDGGSGVYTLKFDPTRPAPAVTEWPVQFE